MESTNSPKERQDISDRPRMLTESEIESMMRDFKESLARLNKLYPYPPGSKNGPTE